MKIKVGIWFTKDSTEIQRLEFHTKPSSLDELTDDLINNRNKKLEAEGSKERVEVLSFEGRVGQLIYNMSERLRQNDHYAQERLENIKEKLNDVLDLVERLEE